MKTLQDHWREYRDKVYPEGISAIQNRECHQAFFAGAMVALVTADKAASTLTEDEAVKTLQSMAKEVMEVCEFRLKTLGSQN